MKEFFAAMERLTRFDLDGVFPDEERPEPEKIYRWFPLVGFLLAVDIAIVREGFRWLAPAPDLQAWWALAAVAFWYWYVDGDMSAEAAGDWPALGWLLALAGALLKGYWLFNVQTAGIAWLALPVAGSRLGMAAAGWMGHERREVMARWQQGIELSLLAATFALIA